MRYIKDSSHYGTFALRTSQTETTLWTSHTRAILREYQLKENENVNDDDNDDDDDDDDEGFFLQDF